MRTIPSMSTSHSRELVGITLRSLKTENDPDSSVGCALAARSDRQEGRTR